MRHLGALLVLASTSVGVSAAAQAIDPARPSRPERPQQPGAAPPSEALVTPPVDDTPPNERRSGFTAGLSASLAAGKASGYPNEVAKLDHPEFRSSTGFGAGQGLTAWFGGALRDWFIFGLGASLDGLSGNDVVAGGVTFLFRIEAYPAYTMGGAWRDVSLFANLGAGSAAIVDAKDTDEILADGGSMSAVGLGAAYEPWRFWRFAAGPFVAYEHRRSLSMKTHTGFVGLRLVFYGGP